jgi:hypothetical protein
VNFPAFFAPCVYEESKKKELISFALHHGVEGLTAIYNELPKVRLRSHKEPSTYDFSGTLKEIQDKVKDPTRMRRLVDAVLRTFLDLFQIVALLKNRSFEEEREWRLLISGAAEDETLQYPRQFRIGTTTLVPYVAYPLTTEPDTPIPLCDVLLGPGSDENSAVAARGLLETQGVKALPRMSSVPYRPW